jgi:DNA-3-methyladenine glycosylase
MIILDKNYFLNDDVIYLVQDLLGKIIQTDIDGIVCSGMIVETEAYKAPEDKASHTYNVPRVENVFANLDLCT